MRQPVNGGHGCRHSMDGTGMKTADLTGPALDWAVYRASDDYEKYAAQFGDDYLKYKGAIGDGDETWSPSTDWKYGGPIIEREKIELRYWGMDGCEAKATDYSCRPGDDGVFAVAWHEKTLIAAMRCYVASKLGDEVEIPEELR